MLIMGWTTYDQNSRLKETGDGVIVVYGALGPGGAVTMMKRRTMLTWMQDGVAMEEDDDVAVEEAGRCCRGGGTMLP